MWGGVCSSLVELWKKVRGGETNTLEPFCQILGLLSLDGEEVISGWPFFSELCGIYVRFFEQIEGSLLRVYSNPFGICRHSLIQ